MAIDPNVVTTAETIAASPLIIPAGDKNPRLEFVPLGPRELGVLRQQVRAERIASVRAAFADDFESGAAREALAVALQAPVWQNEVGAYLTTDDGFNFVVWLSLKKGTSLRGKRGGAPSLEDIEKLELPRELWQQINEWLFPRTKQTADEAAPARPPVAGESDSNAREESPTGAVSV